MITQPALVTIGPVVFTITFDDMEAVKESVIRAKEYDDEPIGELEHVRFEGCITYQDSSIAINKNLEMVYKKVVLMHEILHGISTHTGADLTEKQCDQLAYQLIDLMNNNPLLIDWFQGATNGNG